MATFLLAWNPKRWEWDDIIEMSGSVKNGVSIEDRYSCGRSTLPQRGDHFFMIRLGMEPKGIFASGVITEGSYEDKHWDSQEAAKGNTSRYIHVVYDTLLVPGIDTILSRKLLDEARLAKMNWDTQMSGITIPDEIAFELEMVWTQFCNHRPTLLPEEIEEVTPLREGAIKQVSINSYERNPTARRICISHYGTKCSICGFDFGKFYGVEGEGVIHIHHLKPLSQINHEYEVDPINDLRPVCPNCHTMIHKRNPPYTVEEVCAMINFDF